MKPKHIHTTSNCKPFTELLARIGDKWSVFVVMLLGEGPMRFTEIKRATGSVSQKMLTLTLRGLERDGFVTRSVFATSPPRVEYALTELGQSLKIPVNALGEWAFANHPEVEDARRKFDLAHAASATAGTDQTADA